MHVDHAKKKLKKGEKPPKAPAPKESTPTKAKNPPPPPSITQRTPSTETHLTQEFPSASSQEIHSAAQDATSDSGEGHAKKNFKLVNPSRINPPPKNKSLTNKPIHILKLIQTTHKIVQPLHEIVQHIQQALLLLRMSLFTLSLSLNSHILILNYQTVFGLNQRTGCNTAQSEKFGVEHNRSRPHEIKTIYRKRWLCVLQIWSLLRIFCAKRR